MRQPSVAVALLQLFCRDEALVGDILEEFDHRGSRVWLWRQVVVAVMFGLPYGRVRRERTAQKMPMPIGALGAAGVAALITIVAPGAWWLIGAGAAGGVVLAIALVAIARRRVLREPPGRRNVLLPVLFVCAIAPHSAHAQALKPAVPLDPVDGIVEAFKTHQVVMLPGGSHGTQRDIDLLLRLLRDSRTPGLVTDLVVECATSRWQDLIDRFMRGDAIADAAIRRAWQDTTNAGVAGDRAEVEAFYYALRDINAALPHERRYRLLAGDPPVDWDNVVVREDVRKWIVRRDTFAADVIRREVVERGRRALVFYGPAHFPRKEVLVNYDMSNWQAQTMTSLLVAEGITPFVIQSDSGAKTAGLQPDIATWPVMSLALVHGTVLGAADFTVFNGDNDRFAIRGIDDFVKISKDQYKPMRMEDLADAILWKGVRPAAAPIVLSRQTCVDPAYLPMRLHRISVADLPPGEADLVKKACGDR